MILRGRRGSAQVEAAMILPLVILAVLTVVWLLTLFYQQTALRSSIHLALRSSAGICSDTVLSLEETRSTDLYSSLLSPDQIEGYMEEEGRKRLETVGAKSSIELECKYTTGIIATMKMGFQRLYGAEGLYFGQLKGDGDCWYYCIDEAQWVRNADWLHEAVSSK